MSTMVVGHQRALRVVGLAARRVQRSADVGGRVAACRGVRRQQRVPFDEVLALARLIGRRPDADRSVAESEAEADLAEIRTNPMC